MDQIMKTDTKTYSPDKCVQEITHSMKMCLGFEVPPSYTIDDFIA